MQEQNGEEYEDGAEEIEDSGKKKQADQRKYTKETEKKKGWGNLSALAFNFGVACIIRVYKLW